MSEIEKQSKRRERKRQFNWRKTEVNSNDVFEGAVMDGFLGLDELHDYSAEDFQDICDGPAIGIDEDTQTITHVSRTSKKKPKKENCASKTTDTVLTSTVDNDNSLTSNEKQKPVDHLVPKAAENMPSSKLKDVKQKKLLKSKEKRMVYVKKKKRKKLEKLKEKMKKRKEMGFDTVDKVVHTVKEEVSVEPVVLDKIVEEATDTIEEKSTSPSDEFIESNMGNWLGLEVPGFLLKALFEKGFFSPTPIQKLSILPAIAHRRDIVGAAETGSGKTLAFGIPLVALISDAKASFKQESGKLTEKDKESDFCDDEPLYALVLTPTRELAVQVNKHITDILTYTSIKCVTIVGGMADKKQERLLRKCPEIVVCTPGRLYKLVKEGEPHLANLSSLKFLVIDECDRMMEHGHFKDLKEIIELMNVVKKKRQVFIFSATLTLPEFRKKARKYAQEKSDQEEHLQSLMESIGLSNKAEIVDLTTKHITATMLEQRKVVCTDDQKDIYLLNFLLTHPGRTIVFVNSISFTNKLHSLFTLLGRDPICLHAGKQQRQRLKYLERFTKNENALLIATDVAARGLDIPKVKYVVHYQLPVDPKVYIHRAGRTARAQEGGMSLLLEGPKDMQYYRKISQILKLSEDIPILETDKGFLNGIKERVTLATKIEKLEHKYKKICSDIGWQKRTAKSADLSMNDSIDEEVKMTKTEKQTISRMKNELGILLKQTLYPSGFSGAFPTQSGFLKLPGLTIV